MSALFNILVLVLTTILAYTDCLKFTDTPPKTMTVLRGKSASLKWGFEKKAAADTPGYEIHFVNKTSGGTRKIAETDPTKPQANPIIFSIPNADYEDTGIYFIKLISKGSAPITSTNTSLIIEGAPEILGSAVSEFMSLSEKEPFGFFLKVRSVPVPTIVFHWEDRYPEEKLAQPDNDTFFLSDASIDQGAVSRDRCGRNFLIYMRNPRGISKKIKTKVTVSFIPEHAKNVRAYYVDNESGVKVEWDKQESGLCRVGYRIDFLNESGMFVASLFANDKLSAHFKSDKSNKITEIRIRVNSYGGSVKKNYKVSRMGPPKDKRSKEKNQTWIIVVSVVVSLLMIALIVIIAVRWRWRKRKVGTYKE